MSVLVSFNSLESFNIVQNSIMVLKIMSARSHKF